MPAASISVRALETPAEAEAFFHLAVRTFPGYAQLHYGQADPEITAAQWRQFIEEAPGFEPWQLRGAFSDGAFLGGCLVSERLLCAHSARLRSGYVGSVVTHPEHRRQGVATALMQDALALARERRQALLVLRGIPGFYHQFGYVDVLELGEHLISPAEVLALPFGDCRIRPASLADAPDLLALYERHHYPYPGAYARTLAQQEHPLRARLPVVAPVIAINPTGEVNGYLLLACGPEPAGALEVAADTWSAALSLLQYHARLLGSESPPLIRWPLPPDSLTYYDLADHLTLESRVHSCPSAGHMACPTHLPELFAGLLPLWRERWLRSARDWTGHLALEVGGESCQLELTRSDLIPSTTSAQEPHRVRLSPQVFARLVFGYRSVAWAAKQPGQLIPSEVAASLAVLFPPCPGWYAGSNRC